MDKSLYPSEYIENLFRKHSYGVQIFIATFITGFLTHFYMYTHKMFNYFELGNIFSAMPISQGDTIAQGRWSLPVITNLFTVFSIPSVNGVVSLTCLCLCVVMILDILKIKSRLYGWLFGAAFVTFPGYACILSYGVNADIFAISAFMCVLGAYIWLKKGKWAFIPAVILIGTALGSYQTYLSLSIGLVFLSLFFELYQADESFDTKAFIIKTLKSGAMLACAFIFYYAVLKAACALTGITLSDYHGVDSMTSFTPKGICKGLVYAYGYFFAYFFSDQYIYTIPRILMNVVGALVFLYLSFVRIAKLKKEKKTPITAPVFLFIFLGLTPLGVNSTPFLMADRVGAGVDRYMIPSLMMLWGMLLKLTELSEMIHFNSKSGSDIDFDSCSDGTATGSGSKIIPEKTPLPGRAVIISYAAALSVLVSAFTSGIICNEAYHRMEAATVTTESYLNRIAARLEIMDEYQKGYPVFFAHSRGLLSSTYEVELPFYEALKNLPGTEIARHYNEEGMAAYFQTYLHMPIKDPTDPVRDRIEASREFISMPAYPASGSIAVIDGVIVIKMCEESLRDL